MCEKDLKPRECSGTVISIRILLRLMFLITLVGVGFSSAKAANYYVDATNGVDTNSGTQSLPLKTISVAVSKAFAGDIVWIFSGTYRETINLVRGGSGSDTPITIRSMPKAEVHIRGSDWVSGWVRHAGSIWKRTNWNINSQQVFADGLPLQQIGMNSPFHSRRYSDKPLLPAFGNTLSDMVPGSFCYDTNSGTLYVWLSNSTDPSGHQIEASVRDHIIPPLGNMVNFIHLTGLHFAHSNQTAKGGELGMVNLWGTSWVLSDCHFRYGDFAGVHITGENHQILGSTFTYNGNTGISMNGSDAAHNWAPYEERPAQNIVIEANETSYNNYRNFDDSWHAGGIKAVNSCNTVMVSQHQAVSNKGPGIWFDIFCKNITVDRSIVKNNTAGIFYEISDDALISNNLVLGNTRQGIYVAASSGVRVLNNTVYQNWAGIVLHGMPRADHPTLTKNTVRNNIIGESELVDLVLYSDPIKATGNTSDYNLFFRPDGTVRASLTPSTGYNVNYRNLPIPGIEHHSRVMDPQLGSDFSLKSGSPAINAGQIMEGIGSKDIAGQGRISDGAIDIGAYEFHLSSGKEPPQNLRLLN
jgi:parallel beta-helix repeat protein